MKTLAFTLVVAIAIAVFVVLRAPEPATPKTAATAAANAPGSAKLSAQAVLRIDPRAAAPASPTTSIAKPETPLTAAFRDRRDYAGLYQRVKDAPETAESLYIKARLYATCAKRAGVTPVPRSEQDFIAGLPARDPYREERIAAFRRNNELCRGLELGDFAPAEYQRMLERAAAMGDPSAQARTLVNQIQQASTQANTPAGALAPVRQGFVVTPEQFGALVGQLNSGDPEVLQLVRGVLSSTIDQGQVVFGPEGDPIDPRAMFAALGLVACDLGRRCGPDAQELLNACAQSGQCAARNISDYTYYYQVSPSEAQRIEGYRQAVVEAIRTGAPPPIRLVPRTGSTGGVYMFGIGGP
jgi:hypothetical protein